MTTDKVKYCAILFKLKP